MIIAIDYDGTYAADPETFNHVIEIFRQAGHAVICVTGRSAGTMGQPVLDSIGKIIGEENCIFAGTLWKRMAAEKKGWKVDVWIDDMPEMISRPSGGF